MKSVATLVWRWSKASTLPRQIGRSARARCTSGAPGPAGSRRCGATSACTGLPIAFEIAAASNAASANRWRPNDPPPWITWHGDACRAAARGSAAICSLSPDRRLQARPDLGAVGAHVGDGAVGLERVAGAEVEGEALRRSTWRAGARASAAARRPCRSASTSASDLPSTVPAPQSTSSARTASMHCPNVAARTATPPARIVCAMIATSVTPGIALTAAAFWTDARVPLIVGGRQTIVGSASGTSRSIANFLLAGHGLERVDRAAAGCRPRELGLRLQLRDHRGASSRPPPCGQRADRSCRPAVRRREHARRSTGAARRGVVRGLARRPAASRPLGDRGGDAHRVVERVHRVRAAGELVEHQLGPRVGERHVDLVQREVHLVGDQHRDRGGDALADLGARQGERHRAVGFTVTVIRLAVVSAASVRRSLRSNRSTA